jgi:hypothetical protein
MAAGYHLKQYEELKGLIAKLEQRVKALEDANLPPVSGTEAARKVLKGSKP